jgi:hypothetical protein
LCARAHLQLRISNLEKITSPPVKFVIQLQYPEYKSNFNYNIDSILPGKAITTEPRKWTILTHSPITFRLIKVNGKEVNFPFVDINGKQLEYQNMVNMVVPLPIEGVYEYWALLIAAAGLGGTAIAQLLPYIIELMKFIWKLTSS